jgi:hypothetical protein
VKYECSRAESRNNWKLFDEMFGGGGWPEAGRQGKGIKVEPVQ